MASEALPVVLGLAVGVWLIAIFSLNFTDHNNLAGHIETPLPVDVVIPAGANIDLSGPGFQPQTARVLICFEFVRWSNHDSVAARIEADNDSDPLFYRATKDFVTIMPGGSFDFSFTKPGEYGYHGAPWQRGTIVVQEANGYDPRC